MNRRDNHHSKPVRVNRIERLETRHMLSADGLSCDDSHQDFADELARTSDRFEALRGSEFDLRGAGRNRIGNRSADQTLRLHRDDLNDHNDNRVRSALRDGRSDRTDRHFGIEGRMNDPPIIPTYDDSRLANPPIHTSELVTNISLTLKSRPSERIESAKIESPITSSRITFIIFVPSVSSSLSPSSISSRSVTDTFVRSRVTPPATAADSPAANSLRAGSELQRSEAVQEPTPAERTALEQAEALQLVSVRQRDDFFSTVSFPAEAAIQSAHNGLKTNTGEAAKLEFSFDALRFDNMPLDQLLEHSKSLEDDFAELEELLDAIALERIESMQHRDHTVRPMIPAETHTDTFVESSSQNVSDGMILLLPGGSVANSTVQFAAQVFDRPDDSAISQWTVGVGFYRALEVVGDARFADALIAAEISINPSNRFAAENDVAETFAWQSDSISSSRQAAGVVFCCLGIQYLWNRRKEMHANEVEKFSIRLGEGTLD